MNRQPNYRTRIRRGPLTEGLVFAALPLGASYIDLVSGAVATQADTANPADPSFVAFQNGGASRAGETVRAPKNANSNTSGWVFPRGATGIDNLFNRGTLMALGGCTGAASAYHWIFGSQEDFNGTSLGLMIDDNAFWGPGNVMERVAGTFDTNHTSNALTSDPKGKLHFFGTAFDGVNHYYYSSGNGLIRESNASTVVPSVAGDAVRVTTIGRALSTGTQTGFQNYCALGLGWNRLLSLAEYAQLWANPWQLFEAMGRRVVVGAAVAAATPYSRGRVVNRGGVGSGYVRSHLVN